MHAILHAFILEKILQMHHIVYCLSVLQYTVEQENFGIKISYDHLITKF